MRPYLHPKDAAFQGIDGAQVRQMGRKRRPRSDFRVQAVAKMAPHELDDQPESVIHDQIERDVQDLGLPYITFRERLYHWLKRQAEKHWQARELLEILKDFPDVAVFKRIPGELWCYALLLELKTQKGRARPGQQRLSEAAGGVITHGYTEASRALRRFAGSPGASPRPERSEGQTNVTPELPTTSTHPITR